MKIIQIWFGKNIPKQNKECINQIRKLVDINNFKYEFIHDKSLVSIPQYESDKLRFELASKTEKMLYIDCDIILNCIPNFEFFDKPYFSIYNNLKISAIFYNNNCFDFFKKLLIEADHRKLQPGIVWSTKLLRNKDVYEIPNNNYIHKMISFNKII